MISVITSSSANTTPTPIQTPPCTSTPAPTSNSNLEEKKDTTSPSPSPRSLRPRTLVPLPSSSPSLSPIPNPDDVVEVELNELPTHAPDPPNLKKRMNPTHTVPPSPSISTQQSTSTRAKKRASLIDISTGITHSKHSNSTKKNTKQVHHLTPSNHPATDFRSLLLETDGSYSDARLLLKHRVSDYQSSVIREKEDEFGEGYIGLLFDETVRLSGVSGKPSINTVQGKMKDSMSDDANRKNKTSNTLSATLTTQSNTDQNTNIKIATRRSWVSGELLLPEQKLANLPKTIQSTLHLQLTPPSKISMPRNQLWGILDLTTVAGVSMYYFRYVSELDLGGNDIVELPTDFGRLKNLTKLNLERNRLQDLPGSILDIKALKVLKINHNAFKSLPAYICKLEILEHLNVGNNNLSMLPSTMGKLKLLKYLDVSSNGLASLSIQPVLHEHEERIRHEVTLSKLKAEAEASGCVWDERKDAHTKRMFWYNRNTGVSSNTRPVGVGFEGSNHVSSEHSSSEHSSGEHSYDSSANKNGYNTPKYLDRFITQDDLRDYNARRKVLAVQGISEYTLNMDVASGSIIYTNNVSGSTSHDMPGVLDSFGGMVGLKTFKCNANLIRRLPASICKCVLLEVVEAKSNYLSYLPLEIGNLTKLKILKINSNEIKSVPDTLERCTSLTEVHLTSNYIIRFPEFINKCVNLRKLMLGNNFLKILPFTLGFVTTLEELQLFNNPLVDPPYDVVMAGLESTLYFCRQKYHARVNGLPPKVGVHASGINDECLELQPEFRDRLAKMINTSRSTFSLELQLLNLESVPEQVYEVEGLKNMDLSRNNFSGAPLEWQENLASLQSLFLKSCKMQTIAPNISSVKNVIELNLEDNALTFLPAQICRLRRLKFFNLNKNKLYNLPESLGELSELKELILDINRLETLPESLRELRHLEVLSANRNWLYSIDPVVNLSIALVELSIDCNFITTLPEEIGNLKLRVLKVSHNRLEYLPDDILLPNLILTLKVLWLSSNNLVELPRSLTSMQCIDDIKIEYNPMESPPGDLITEGIHTVIQYCRVRYSRINEINELIVDAGFDTDVRNYIPVSENVLTGETGYLTREDLREFDSAVDCYLNGKYYLYPAPAVEMVEKVESLRHDREFAFYHLLLKALLKVVSEEVNSRGRFSKSCLRADLVRPWGRDCEQVACYAIPIHVLLRETLSNYFVSEDRPSIYDIMKETLPDTIFEYNEDALKEALNNFESPYGPIAGFDKVGYDNCECVDADNDELRHFPCTIPSAVIVRTIYTASEATRRSVEESKLEGYFQTIETSIQKWLNTPSGRKVLTAEMHNRSKLNKTLIKLGIESLDRLTKKDLVDAKEGVVSAGRRKKDYEDGKAFPFHLLDNAEAAVACIGEAEELLKETEDAIRHDMEKMEKLRKRMKANNVEESQQCIDDITKRNCYYLFSAVYTQGRELAKLRGWRRPWDGVDGEDFIAYQYKSYVGRHLAGEGDNADRDDSDSHSDDGRNHDSDDERVGAGGETKEVDEDFHDDDVTNNGKQGTGLKSLKIQDLLELTTFDFEGTGDEDMIEYENEPYTKYTKSLGKRISSVKAKFKDYVVSFGAAVVDLF